MKTKTNKEIIKKLKKIKIDHTDSDNDGFNRLCSTEISKIMNIFTQALEQKEREVREEIAKNMSHEPDCRVYDSSWSIKDPKCDCGLDDVISNLKSKQPKE